MKKKLFLVLFVLFGINTIAQEKSEISPGQLPAEVKAKFEKDFPTAHLMNLEKEGGNYEMTFKVDNVNMSAVYDIKGNRKEVEKEIEESTLPPSVFDYIKKNYSGYKLKSSSQLMTDKAVKTYEVEITKDNKVVSLIFDASGKFKKKEKSE